MREGWVAAPPGKYLHVAASSCVCGPAEFRWRRAWRMAAEGPCAQSVLQRRYMAVPAAAQRAGARRRRQALGKGSIAVSTTGPGALVGKQ